MTRNGLSRRAKALAPGSGANAVAASITMPRMKAPVRLIRNVASGHWSVAVEAVGQFRIGTCTNDTTDRDRNE